MLIKKNNNSKTRVTLFIFNLVYFNVADES